MFQCNERQHETKNQIETDLDSYPTLNVNVEYISTK